MDFTKENRKMLEKATEIQRDWEPERLDNVSLYSSRRYIIKELFQYGEIQIEALDKADMGYNYYKKEDLIFIPRQDQLFDKIKEKFPSSSTDLILDSISYFIRDNTLQKETLEKIYLRCLMFLSYKKEWNGEDWVKEGEDV